MIVLQILHSSVVTLGLSILFLIMNAFDAHSTWLVLRPDHYSRERNPIARWVFRKLKLPGGIIFFKAVLLGILIPSIAYYTAWDSFTINIVLLVANLVFVLVALHNYRVYRRSVKTLYSVFDM
ncbi:MAG: DUF5658 family protein [Candidatus Cloacimonadaceae bacterium]|nr:DUF5658 family protein [Candidatus Cloacimonadaceae bacterium]